MGFKYPSDEWMKELKRICNDDKEFKDAVGTFGGIFVFQLEPEPGKLEKRTYLFLQIQDGNITNAGELPSIDDRPDLDYILEGSFSVWKDVITGKREPLRAIMTRKLKLVKGKQLALLKNTKMAMRMINNCVKVDTAP